jgi:dUTP pyrophosphatase
MKISVRRLPHARDLPLPAYATPGSAGLDLMAAIEREIWLTAGEHVAVPTGIAIALPPGYEAQVRPRSGLAFRHGITVLNAPGTIDSDYRGEVTVLLVNHGKDAFAIARRMKIAQLVVAPYARIEWEESPALDSTERGAGGFGSTGLRT